VPPKKSTIKDRPPNNNIKLNNYHFSKSQNSNKNTIFKIDNEKMKYFNDNLHTQNTNINNIINFNITYTNNNDITNINEEIYYGITNSGNTCYINSLLQIIKKIKRIRTYIMNTTDSLLKTKIMLKHSISTIELRDKQQTPEEIINYILKREKAT
jgi:uncharacterized UBP type Zn finger protein